MIWARVSRYVEPSFGMKMMRTHGVIVGGIADGAVGSDHLLVVRRALHSPPIDADERWHVSGEEDQSMMKPMCLCSSGRTDLANCFVTVVGMDSALSVSLASGRGDKAVDNCPSHPRIMCS